MHIDNSDSNSSFKRALSQKSICLQIDPESYEWGLSARSVDLKGNQ